MSFESDPLIQALKACLAPLEISNGTDQATREGQRRASVLIPLVRRGGVWNVILTQRPEHMPRHPGQISFPGGRVEKGETALQAALRETEEEIGIAPSLVTPIGRLASFDAVSLFRVTPFVGIVDSSAIFTIDPNEVDDVFEQRFDFFMNSDNHNPRNIEYKGENIRLYDMPYTQDDGTHRNVWGMTAMMLYRLHQKLEKQEYSL